MTNLSGAQSAELRYTMVVPAGASNLQFQISGGSGDADLYVRFGSAPTTSAYDCRPYLGGNNETCTIRNTAGRDVSRHVARLQRILGRDAPRFSYSTGGGSGSCAAGFTQYTGTLASRASAYAPSTSGVAAVAGLHSGRLTGPASADFDLFLQRRSGSTWTIVARGEDLVVD